MTDPTFFASGESPTMRAAIQQAQDTFQYFWRELTWESRRVVPALDLACVKVAFSQTTATANEPIIEHLWIDQIQFNGETIFGLVMNDPHDLNTINKGDAVAVPLTHISDWLLSSDKIPCGGFTIQAMRSDMTPSERQAHDQAWNLHFGDVNDVLLVVNQKTHPEYRIEHPMSLAMKEKFIKFLQVHPQEINSLDEHGNTLLHCEAIAGNATIVNVLKEMGAQLGKTNKVGKTALDYAKQFKWDAVVGVLESEGK